MENQNENPAWMVRYESKLSVAKMDVLKRLAHAGVVNGPDDVLLAAKVMDKHGVGARALITWKNRGINLPDAARFLELQLYLRENTSFGKGKGAVSGNSIIALHGFAVKLGLALRVSFKINPESGLPEISEVPDELVQILDTLMEAVQRLPGTNWSLQRMLHIVNHHYNGDIRRAYYEANVNPETFSERAQGMLDDLHAADRMSSRREDSDEIPEDVRRLLRGML